MTLRPTTILDAVDRGFLRRLEAQAGRRRPVVAEAVANPPAPPCPVVVSAAAAGTAAPATAVSVSDSRAVAAVVSPSASVTGGTLVDRLLQAVPQIWENLAERVEAARRGGASVIAVTGARRGEGRTTVVQCLARTLERRGRRVLCQDRVPLDTEPASSPEDSPLVLVDAGVWFPGGPLRRAWLETQSIGCDAAIVVRRAGQAECPARGAVLESIGLKVLGEVVTMAPPTMHSLPLA